jgi:hypothetical protein
LSAAVRTTLGAFVAARDGASPGFRSDPGPLVLAASAARALGTPLDEATLDAWLDALAADGPEGRISFGPTCALSGLAAARPLVPRLGRLHRSLWDSVATSWDRGGAPSGDLSWNDYDVIDGPAGMLLHLAAARRPPARLVDLCVRRLAALCADDDLGGMRLGHGGGRGPARWNRGRIDTGVAHGVAGVALALAAVLSREPRAPLRGALTRLADWLVSQSYADERGVRTWAPAGLDGRVPPPSHGRQTWCYGTPGIAWALWESGRALRRPDLRAFALAAMGSFCDRFDPAFHLDADPLSRLGFCHGAAGTLAVADAFSLHARSAPASRLASRLDSLLLRSLPSIRRLSASDTTLLTGTSGILCVLLTRRGAPRRWLRPFGLR